MLQHSPRKVVQTLAMTSVIIICWNFVQVMGVGQPSTIVRRIIFSPNISPPPPFYSHGVQIDQTLYISGQLGLNQSNHLVKGFEAQTRLALDNIGYILRAAGADFDHVIKTTVLLSDIQNYPLLNKIYASYFPDKPPARMAYQVSNLPRNGLVEVEAVAVVGDIIDE